MKKLLPIALFTLLALTVHAQLRLAVEGNATIGENLGIGIATPLEKIHIYDGNLALEWPGQPIDQGKLYLMRTNIVNANNSSGYKFSWRNDDGSARKDAMYFDRNGDVYFPGLSKVGIGTNDPSESLEVMGNTKILGRIVVQQGSFNQSIFIGIDTGINDDEGAAAQGDSNYNNFFGYKAGENNTRGRFNNFLGWGAGRANTTASNNTFMGDEAGTSNTTGTENTFIGKRAGALNTSGSELTALGANAGTTACCNLTDNAPINNAFTIGSHSLITTSHSGVLGNISLQKIGGYVNWGTASDGRMKKAVQEDIKGLDFILQLRPVSYQVDAVKLDRFLRKGMDAVSKSKDGTEREKVANRRRSETYDSYLRAKSKIRYTGFIAQEVERAAAQADFAFSGVVKPSNDQDHYSLRYAEFVVPLVKGMQEQQEIITALQSEVTELKILVQQLLADRQNQTPVQSYELTDKQQARLSQNYPNPFHEDTLIDYVIPDEVQRARLEIHSVDGKLLQIIPIQHTGQGRIRIKAGSYPAGTYLYSLLLDEKVVTTKQMILTQH